MSQLTVGKATTRSQGHPSSISLILPAWNESEALPRAVREADAALRSVTTDYEVIVVDDGSTDDTAKCLQALKSEYSSLRVLRHETNYGYGAALRTGFAAARCDLVVFTDADVQFDLREIDRFVLLARDYDIVCGYRIDRQDPPLRCFYSRVYNFMVRTLVGTKVRDIDCAFKMFRRETLEQFTITTDGFLVNTELLTQAGQQNCSIVEVGVTHLRRREGQSSVSVGHVPVVLASLLRFWWNQVQFPGREPAGRANSEAAVAASVSDSRFLWLQAVLLLIAAMFLLTQLSYPLIDRDETRYAEIPREMIVSGDWLVPQLNFETYYDKPPLLYWACAASFSVFGVSEWPARLIPALSGLFTLTTTMFFGNRLFNRRTGLFAGIVLFLSVGFLGGSRVLLIDGLLTSFVSLSLFAAFEATRRSRLETKWWLLAGATAGLGFLAKGPIALVLFLPPIVAYAWLTEHACFPKPRHWLLWGSVVTLVAAPWFIAVSMQIPDFAYQFFYRHNVERFGGAFHEKPIWFFLPVLLLGGHPWSYLALPCLHFFTSRTHAIRDQRTPTLGFAILWATWCLAFFTISGCKLPPYILPAAPPLSLVIARLLQDVVFAQSGIRWSAYATRWAPWLATTTSVFAAIGFVVFGVRSEFESLGTLALVVVFGVAIAGVGVSLRHHLHLPAVNWGVCIVTTFFAALLVLHREVPRYAVAHSLFGSTSPLKGEFAPTLDMPVVTVGHEWSDVPFYLNRDDIINSKRLEPAELAHHANVSGRLLMIVRRKDRRGNALPALPPGVRVISMANRGRATLLLLDLGRERDRIAQPLGPDAIVR